MVRIHCLLDNLGLLLNRFSFITKVNVKRSWDHFFGLTLLLKQYIQKSQFYISTITPPCWAAMFICALCTHVLASVHGFSLSLPKPHPKDSLIKSPEYESDLFYSCQRGLVSLSPVPSKTICEPWLLSVRILLCSFANRYISHSTFVEWPWL